MFDPIKELVDVALYMEKKVPTDVEDYIEEKVEHFKKNGINKSMHIGKTDEWKKEEIAEWLLGQFVGTFEAAKKNKDIYNSLSKWSGYVHAIFIKKEPN